MLYWTSLCTNLLDQRCSYCLPNVCPNGKRNEVKRCVSYIWSVLFKCCHLFFVPLPRIQLFFCFIFFPLGINARLTVSFWFCSYVFLILAPPQLSVRFFFFFLSFPRFLKAYGKSTLTAHKSPLPALKILGCKLSGAADLKNALLQFLCLRLSLVIVRFFWY